MSDLSKDSSKPSDSSSDVPVNFGAVAPNEPYARAPVELEASLSVEQSSGEDLVARSDSASWYGADRRSRANQRAGVMQLADLVPALRLLIGLLIASILILALFYGRDMLIPLALAMLFGFLLDPAVSRLKRWGLPRMASAIVVVMFALAALGGLGMYLGSQIQQLSADLPTYQSTIRDKLRGLRQSANMPSAWDGVFKTYNTVEKEISSADSAKARVQKVEVQAPESKPTTQLLQWLVRIAEPLTTAGIVLLFVILILLDRDDLRDRLLRLVGGNFHVATDALDEASERIGNYLRMQFIVNVCYGIPLATGLWFIGVPGAILWGVLGAIMRFVPYVGPLMSAVFPLALAFAVDPSWNMFLLALGLILLLELISNNVIEPWLYGSSTGLSTLAIIVAATFWTALWGPIGLILSTPLTVCLLVLGRYIPALKFMEVLLGSEPVLGPQQRLYQRLLADDAEDAISMAVESVEERLPPKPSAEDRAYAVSDFYDEVAIPALRIASQQHTESATAEHRLRLSSGMGALLEELREHYSPKNIQRAEFVTSTERRRLRIHCAGARWEVDALGAAMVAHAEGLHGHEVTCSESALSSDAQALSSEGNESSGLSGLSGSSGEEGWLKLMHHSDLLVLSTFSNQPQIMAQRMVRRIRRFKPQARVVLCLWNAPAVAADPDFAVQCGVQACVTSLHELHLWVEAMQVDDGGGKGIGAPVPEADEMRVKALHDSGVLTESLKPLYYEVAKQAVNAFNTKWAQVSWVDADRVYIFGSVLPSPEDGVALHSLPRGKTVSSYVVYDEEAIVVGDLARDPRFASDATVQRLKLRFYGGVPLRDKKGHVLGCFSILDDEPRNLSDDELELLTSMAQQLMEQVRDALKQGPSAET